MDRQERQLLLGIQIMQVSKETIWHFTCQSCDGFWSIAASDKWVPKKLFCPHCGKQRFHDRDLIEWVDAYDSFDSLPG
jgi:rRNA maturation endonuclease Nob1